MKEIVRAKLTDICSFRSIYKLITYSVRFMFRFKFRPSKDTR